MPGREALVQELFLRAARQRRIRSILAVRVSFRPFRSTLYSYRVAPDGTAAVRFHVAFRAAPEEVLWQAAHLMLCRRSVRRGQPRAAYDAFVRGLPASAFEPPGARPARPRARSHPGRHRSLEESFARVNAAYFESQMPRPGLCWSPLASRRVLGSYQERTDRVIVSRRFDSARVPLYVLDYLMYHELLHKHLGIRRNANGRRCIHGPHFQRLERRFAQYRAALDFLKQW